MTKFLCSACLGLGVSLLVLDVGKAARGWSLGPAVLSETRSLSRKASLGKRLRILWDKLFGDGFPSP